MKSGFRLLLSASALMFSLLLATGAQAQRLAKQPTKTVELKGTTVAPSRGANPKIKHDMSMSDTPKPASRGDVCGIYFDNYTGLTIKIYVDGDYHGTVSPYGDNTVVVGSGYTTIYCVSMGGTREWNASGNCDDIYRYKLQ